jgi:hypothetical protein
MAIRIKANVKPLGEGRRLVGTSAGAALVPAGWREPLSALTSTQSGHGNLRGVSEPGVLSVRSMQGTALCVIRFHGPNIAQPSAPVFHEIAPDIDLPRPQFATGAQSARWRYQPKEFAVSRGGIAFAQGAHRSGAADYREVAPADRQN